MISHAQLHRHHAVDANELQFQLKRSIKLNLL